MRKLLTITAILISNLLIAQLPYSWTAGVNPGWVSSGGGGSALSWQAGCGTVTTNCAGNYPNNLNTFYTSPTIDASCSSTISLTFTFCGTAENGYDFLFIEYSLNNGATWINPYGAGVGWTAGIYPPCTPFTIPTIVVPSSATFKFRFNFQSDGSFRYAGYRISDFDIWCNTPLPVELVDFHCESKPDNITLYWATATETNNQEFQLWRSPDAINWTKIITKPGAGTSSTPNMYWFIDYFPSTGTYYYKLIQKDYNGHEVSSDITSCSFVENAGIKITYYNMLNQVVIIDNASTGFYIKEYSSGINTKREIYYKR